MIILLGCENPHGAKMKAQDQYLKQRQTHNERASKLEKEKMQNVALIRFTSAGIRIISHAEKKTGKVIEKR